MIEIDPFIQQILVALVGSFGTAYLHERTGRDVRFGGLLGLLIGFFLSIVGLIGFWIWVYYSAGGLSVRAYNSRRRWYNWFLP